MVNDQMDPGFFFKSSIQCRKRSLFLDYAKQLPMSGKQNALDPKKYYFIDTSFNLLMKRRIYQVLLISSNYDAFMLEEDGRIDETIFLEYVSLSLRYPPQFIKITSEEEAFEVLEDKRICLLYTSPS